MARGFLAGAAAGLAASVAVAGALSLAVGAPVREADGDAAGDVPRFTDPVAEALAADDGPAPRLTEPAAPADPDAGSEPPGPAASDAAPETTPSVSPPQIAMVPDLDMPEPDSGPDARGSLPDATADPGIATDAPVRPGGGTLAENRPDAEDAAPRPEIAAAAGLSEAEVPSDGPEAPAGGAPDPDIATDAPSRPGADPAPQDAPDPTPAPPAPRIAALPDLPEADADAEPGPEIAAATEAAPVRSPAPEGIAAPARDSAGDVPGSAPAPAVGDGADRPAATGSDTPVASGLAPRPARRPAQERPVARAAAGALPGPGDAARGMLVDVPAPARQPEIAAATAALPAPPDGGAGPGVALEVPGLAPPPMAGPDTPLAEDEPGIMIGAAPARPGIAGAPGPDALPDGLNRGGGRGPEIASAAPDTGFVVPGFDAGAPAEAAFAARPAEPAPAGRSTSAPATPPAPAAAPGGAPEMQTAAPRPQAPGAMPDAPAAGMDVAALAAPAATLPRLPDPAETPGPGRAAPEAPEATPADRAELDLERGTGGPPPERPETPGGAETGMIAPGAGETAADPSAAGPAEPSGPAVSPQDAPSDPPQRPVAAPEPSAGDEVDDDRGAGPEERAAEQAPEAEAPEDAAPPAGTQPRIGTPAGRLTERAGAVTTGRLPAIGTASDSPEAPEGEAPAAAVTAAGETPPLLRFAAKSDAAPDSPRLGVVLIDDGTGPLGPQALEAFPFPVTFAVDPALPDAGERMRGYREKGFEVMALVGLPQGAKGSDVEVTLEAALSTVPEAIGVLEAPGLSMQQDRAVSDHVAERLRTTGHGLVMMPNGLNTAQALAERAGVPSVSVFRDLDGEGQDARVQRRTLDQAAFRARQTGEAVVLGRLRADTVSAMVLWSLQDRASQVSLVPVSEILRDTPAGR